ncbi:MAG: hypothetical protein ACE5KU_01210 [Nitrososphaerales archaeon]
MNTHLLNLLHNMLETSGLDDLLIPIILLVLAIGFAGFTILYLLGKGYIK